LPLWLASSGKYQETAMIIRLSRDEWRIKGCFAPMIGLSQVDPIASSVKEMNDGLFALDSESYYVSPA
jgi:hypothetical protein